MTTATVSTARRRTATTPCAVGDLTVGMVIADTGHTVTEWSRPDYRTGRGPHGPAERARVTFRTPNGGTIVRRFRMDHRLTVEGRNVDDAIARAYAATAAATAAA